MDKKIIGINSLVTLGLVLSSLFVPSFFDEPKYYCESRPEIGLVNCDNFSKYISENGKCIRNEDTNLICRDGWSLVINDSVIPEEEYEELFFDNGDYICYPNPKGCIKIM